MESLFGRYEAAALLAVERANGGELAPLEQVIVAFEALFGASVAASTFAESLALLIDARLIDWSNRGLELTLDGRRTIRRSGSHWDADFPDKVADRLSRIEEDELSPEGELPAPTEHDVLQAMESLGRGRLEGNAPVPGEVLAPSGIAGHQTIGARLLSGLPAGYGIRVEVPGVNSPPFGAVADPVTSPPLVAPLADPQLEHTAEDERDAGADNAAHKADEDR
ncbi:MAG: hypothetical protein ACLQK4_06190 [Acidimicrobiales bacterium]|jgi:hypothetical protein